MDDCADILNQLDSVKIEEGAESAAALNFKDDELKLVEERIGNSGTEDVPELTVEPEGSNALLLGTDGQLSVDDPLLLVESGAVPKPGSVDDNTVRTDGTAANELYCLQVLGQYLHSVRTKENHSSFLKDAVVGPFLSLCLASNSDKILVGVLKVINVLVKNRDNLSRLRELLHFTDALLAASRNENIHGAIRQKASNFHDLITNSKKRLFNNVGTLNKAHQGDAHPSECTKPLSSARKTQVFVNHNLNKERRFVITRALVRIDGVISIAFNPEQHLCIIRSRCLRPENLGLAIANLGFECSLVTRNENNEIIRVPMVAESKFEKKENREVPFYFPEEDDEEAVCENAIAVQGFAENDDGSGWWTSAKKLVRKSLFW